MQTVGARIRAAREAAGYAYASDAARALGVEAPTYRMYERGDREPDMDLLSAMGRKYGRSVDYLLTGRESSTRKAIRTVPLIGYVGAGNEAHFYAAGDPDLGEVDAPDGSTENTRAAEIRGQSMGVLFDRWLVFFDDVRTPVTPDLIGRVCVVGLPDDRVLIKQLKKAQEPGHFHLLSNAEPPIFDQAVTWAAKVLHMAPR